MARYHGKKGRLYMSTSAAGTAAPVASLSEWTLDQSTERVEVTSFGDLNRQFVQGFANSEGTFSGFWDDTEDTLFQAKDSVDGVKMYLYPSTDAASKYWYGLAWVDASINVSATGAVQVSGSFAAAGNWGRQ